MKYFLVSTQTVNTPIPHVTDWFKQIDRRDITPERAGNISQWTLLDINNGKDAVFPDILSSPGYLISPLVHGVLTLYDSYINCKRVVMLDKSSRVNQLYFLPVLPECDCLLPESEFDRTRSKIIHGVIDLNKVNHRPMIKLAGVTNTHIAFRLDLVESILRRGAKGIKLDELEIKGA